MQISNDLAQKNYLFSDAFVEKNLFVCLLSQVSFGCVVWQRFHIIVIDSFNLPVGNRGTNAPTTCVDG